MIKCFKEIKNLGAYEDFIWTQSFSDNTKKGKATNHYFFEKVNIIKNRKIRSPLISSFLIRFKLVSLNL